MIKIFKKPVFFNKIRNKIIVTMLISFGCSAIIFFSILDFGDTYIFRDYGKKAMLPTVLDENRVNLEPIRITLDPITITESIDKRHPMFNAYIVAVLIFVFVFFIISLAFFFDKRTKYLEYITTSLGGISTGDFYIKLKVTGNDEFSFLADRINMMAEKIQEKFEEERELVQSKNTLIANLSHDLKSPLTSIIGYLMLVRESPNLSEEEKNYINIIFNNSQRLKNRLDELFEFTKLNNSNLKLNYANINISKLAKQYHQEQESILNNLGFQSCIDIEEDIYLSIDIEKFMRIFDNIYTNVQKYGMVPGEFFVSLVKVGNKVILSFKNSIDNSKKLNLIRIFDEFYRGDEARSDKNSGGLGLFIVKKIVELHNGKTMAEIEDDKYFAIKAEFIINKLITVEEK